MELFVLTCLEAQLILKNIVKKDEFPPKIRIEMIEEIKYNAPKECELPFHNK